MLLQTQSSASGDKQAAVHGSLKRGARALALGLHAAETVWSFDTPVVDVIARVAQPVRLRLPHGLPHVLSDIEHIGLQPQPAVGRQVVGEGVDEGGLHDATLVVPRLEPRVRESAAARKGSSTDRLMVMWCRVVVLGQGTRRSGCGMRALDRDAAEFAAWRRAAQNVVQVHVRVRAKEGCVAQPETFSVFRRSLGEQCSYLEADDVDVGAGGGEVQAEDAARASNVHMQRLRRLRELLLRPAVWQSERLHVNRFERIDVVANFLLADGTPTHVRAQWRAEAHEQRGAVPRGGEAQP